MKRFLLSFIITIALGLGLYFLITAIFTSDNNSEIPEIEEVTYEFDDSYSTQTLVEDLAPLIASKEEIIILIGKKEEEATKKVSSLLGSIDNIDNLNVYYLEKEDQIEKTSAYQNLLTNYEELSSYMNFAPVILVFKNNTFIGGLPGEVEIRNIKNFLEYTEVGKS